jgi:hypothetical protein
MHANEDRLFIRLPHDVIDRRFHSFDNILRTFASFDALACNSFLPLIKHIMIVFVFLSSHGMTLLCSPAYFIQAYERVCGYAECHEIFYGLLAPFERRGVNFVKRYMLVRLKKSMGLLPPEFVEVSINTTTLYDVFQIKIGLAVPYQVNFFAVQFSAILGPAFKRFFAGCESTTSLQAGAKIDK